MGKTDPDASRHRQQSQMLVPRDTPGLDRRARHDGLRATTTTTTAATPSCSSTTCACRSSNLIGEEGDGFAIAQARLGPGRIHHCMRSIGMAERAIELMCQRAADRVAFGRPLADQGVVRDWIAESRVRIEQLRLLVLKTAWLMDTVGNKGAHTEIQAIKIATPQTVAVDPRQGDPGARRRRALARTSRSPRRSPASAPCASPTARTRCTRTPSPRPRSDARRSAR